MTPAGCIPDMMTTRLPANPLRSHRALALLAVAASIAILAAACGGDSKTASPTQTAAPPSPAASVIADPPGASERGILRGTMTLDGAPVTAQFLGAGVVRDGLLTACQFNIPDVSQGRYEIQVVSDAEIRGCGAPGAQVVLWIFTNGQFIHAQQPAPWPGNGAAASFDATFSSATPMGATKPVTEFKGRVFDSAGNQRGGRVVEAFVDDVRCAVTSTRYGSDTDHFFTLVSAGPDYIPACAQGATLTFKVDGKPMPQTAVNDLSQGAQGKEINFTTD